MNSETNLQQRSGTPRPTLDPIQTLCEKEVPFEIDSLGQRILTRITVRIGPRHARHKQPRNKNHGRCVMKLLRDSECMSTDAGIMASRLGISNLCPDKPHPPYHRGQVISGDA